MSDHFSGPRALADPAADMSGVFAFPSPEGTKHLARFSHTIFATTRGFARRRVGVLRTSFGVAPEDAGSSESLPVLRVQRRRGALVGLWMMPRG
jgi:hypothetical protein